MDAVSAVAAPLLAGFSITLVGVVAQASPNFALPGAAMLTLSAAAIFFVVSVQCGYWARQYLASPADLIAWDLSSSDAQKIEQARNSRVYESWQSRAGRSYEIAIVLLTVGLGITLVPLGTDSTADYVVRWVAVGVVGFAFVFEIYWIAGPEIIDRIPGLRKVKPLATANLNWFYPARDRHEEGG
jgi:hypothetical protein